MKRCSKISCWTDYPFEQLGDVAGELAPLRQVTIFHYDGNKMAGVESKCGAVEWIKAGYLYRNRARLSQGSKALNRRKLERMISTQPLEVYEGLVTDVSDGVMSVNLRATYEYGEPKHDAKIRLCQVSKEDVPLVKVGATFSLTMNKRTGQLPLKKQAPLQELIFLTPQNAEDKFCLVDSASTERSKHA